MNIGPLDNDLDRGSISVLDRQLLEQEVEPGDRERFSHYVKKNKVLESALSGTPVEALCGKVWVPGRDPEKFPICPTCKEIYDSLDSGNSSDNSGDNIG